MFLNVVHNFLYTRNYIKCGISEEEMGEDRGRDEEG